MHFGEGNFHWFFGVVEDVNDPLQQGRVRVRPYYTYTDEKSVLPTDVLPWAVVIQSINSAADGSIGISPTGMRVGTTVFGFFTDGDDAQTPVVLGTLAGTGDPPFLSRPDDTSTVPTAREVSYTSDKINNRTKDVPDGLGGKWSEPIQRDLIQYPYNKVMQTESGHIIEVDDSPGYERLHKYHKSGTFEEISSDGTTVTRIVSDNYTIVAGNDYINVKGNVNITVDNNCNIYVKGVTNLTSPTTNVYGNMNIDGDLNITGTSTAEVDHVSAGISGKGHTHLDTTGLGAGTTSKPQ